MSEPTAATTPATSAHLSVGTDIEAVERFAGTDGRRDVLFSDAELAHAAAGVRAERLTGTWCAKEAVVKALWPWLRLDPRRVSVVRDGDGRPDVVVAGHDLAGLRVQVSISHTSTFASAVAVAWGPPPAPSGRRSDEEQSA